VTGVLGGSFNPPHNGHVELARAALERFGLERLLVPVVDHPGHKDVELDPEIRLRLARAAFAGLPRTTVERDEHARTVDSLRALGLVDPLFVVGADEFADFPTWKDPDGVLELARLAVGTRPGYPREALEDVLAGLRRPDRVLFFEIEPFEISSRDIRDRVARGESVDALVPSGVADLIRELGLYRHDRGLH
jgi:nicotinate-nucleotide adenylyltransferase